MSVFTITEIHAFVAIGPDPKSPENGEAEGIIGANLGLGWMPFVAADATRLAQLRPVAVQIARATGRTIKLVKFTTRVELETITP